MRNFDLVGIGGNIGRAMGLEPMTSPIRCCEALYHVGFSEMPYDHLPNAELLSRHREYSTKVDKCKVRFADAEL